MYHLIHHKDKYYIMPDGALSNNGHKTPPRRSRHHPPVSCCSRPLNHRPSFRCHYSKRFRRKPTQNPFLYLLFSGRCNSFIKIPSKRKMPYSPNITASALSGTPFCPSQSQYSIHRIPQYPQSPSTLQAPAPGIRTFHCILL